MKTNMVGKIHLIELNVESQKQINGGGILETIPDKLVKAAAAGSAWAWAGLWFFEETVMSPKAAIDAFMRGWNSCL
jgi:hypothetical protein